MTLDFKGPFHFDHLSKLADVNNPGIYIWGFVYELESDGIELKKTVDFTSQKIPDLINQEKIDLPKNWKFIPHYVGLASGKSNVFINTRLKQHHNVRKGNAAKYKRLSSDYMLVFFKDNKVNNFPVWIKGITNNNDFTPLIKSGKITYIFDKKDNLLITDPKFSSIIDTLNEIVTTRNNFWFYYTELNECAVNEITEAYVFWSLKGKTISQTLPYNKIECYKDCYEFKEKLSIFKDNYPSNVFLGDY